MSILSALTLIACFCTTERAGTVNFILGELMKVGIIVPPRRFGIDLTSDTSFTNCMAPSHFTIISTGSLHQITLQLKWYLRVESNHRPAGSYQIHLFAKNLLSNIIFGKTNVFNLPIFCWD